MPDKTSKNDTQIAAEHELLISEARLNQVVKINSQINKTKWMLSDNEWQTRAEFKGVLHVTQIASTQLQTKRLFLGAFASMIKAVTLCKR